MDQPLLIHLVPLDHEALTTLLANIAEAFPTQPYLVLTPDQHEAPNLIPYTPTSPYPSTFTLTAADFLAANQQLALHPAQAILQLGAGADSLSPAALAALAHPVLTGAADLTLPCYDLPPNAGLVNSAILFPLIRALIGTPSRFPLALDLALTPRALARLAATAARTAPDTILWPPIECAAAAFTVTEVSVGHRALPAPSNQDLTEILTLILTSLFTEIELRAPYWQRARTAPISVQGNPGASALPNPDINPMVESFRLAYTNLQEIWSLVLPAQSLLGLKRLSVTPATSFLLPDSLWARIIYDFLLAFRLRTINRGHLLGALTPLYLAWVASHLLQTSHGTPPETHIEATAKAFEVDKPYLVARWRWPDRFTP